MSLGNNIKMVRMQKGLSQSELAKLAGYKDRSTIAKIESGVNDVTQSKLSVIADALNVTPAELLGYGVSNSDLIEENNPAPTTESGADKEFIELFQHLSPEEKKMLMAQMRGLLDNQ